MSIEKILKPKSDVELMHAEQLLNQQISKIHDEFIDEGRDDIIDVDHEYGEIGYDGETGILINFIFENPMDINDAETILSGFPVYDFQQLDSRSISFILDKRVLESIGGAGGAGYAVYGGGAGRSYGNSLIRGNGFGGSSNNGGPNLMYTYDIKPLNQDLQPPPSDPKPEEYIHSGSKIKGHVLGSDGEDEVEGQILHIEEDEDNNIKWYVVLDDQGIKQKVDPTTAYIVSPEEFIDPFTLDFAALENENGELYPLLVERKTLKETTNDVKGQIERSKKIPKEIKQKILPLVIKNGIHGTSYNNGIVTRLKIPRINGKSFDS